MSIIKAKVGSLISINITTWIGVWKVFKLTENVFEDLLGNKKSFTAKINARFDADLTFKDFSRINCSACECERACVFARERETVWVRERERETDRERKREREKEKESERESGKVKERERESGKVREWESERISEKSKLL